MFQHIQKTLKRSSHLPKRKGVVVDSTYNGKPGKQVIEMPANVNRKKLHLDLYVSKFKPGQGLTDSESGRNSK